jgi:hypothetical protein
MHHAPRKIARRFVPSTLLAAGALLACSTAFADPAAAPATTSSAAAPKMAMATTPATTATPATTVAGDATPPAPDQITAPMNGSTMQGALSAFGGLGYGWGLGVGYGVGARFQYDFLPKGVLHLPGGKHDEMGIEAGVDYFHVSYDYFTGYSETYNEVTPVVGWVWNFWLTDKLAVYPKVDVGYRIGSYSYSDAPGHTTTAHSDVFPIYFQGAAGVVYRVGPVALRAEAGWEALRVGVGIDVL